MREKFPLIQPRAEEEKKKAPALAREVKWDFIGDRPVYKNGQPVWVTGNDAIRVWIWNALKTVRRRYKVFTWDYGCDVENLIGRDYSEQVKQMEAKRYIEECLLIHPYILAVNNIETDFSEDKLQITCNVTTIYGELLIGGEEHV
ncbi:MAG: DUF2634 domain-containing protein [Clostridiales bacterium]|nr:DUF2634 domain-containing protein [Clostridiales bacterium]